MVATKLMTAAELASLPDDGFRYELDEGVLRRMPPPGFRHGRVQNRAGRVLGDHADETGAGVVVTESGFMLAGDPDRVFAPDVAFVRADRIPTDADEAGYLPLAPDLVVEVLSPSDVQSDVEAKVAKYIVAGVRLVWLLDADRQTVSARRPDGWSRRYQADEELDGGDVLPTFRVRVADLFA